ncbi:MAG: hypothetical protein QOE02_2538 [Rhodospirillaceae bacterium]|nr:hypothetical protein [Rhodospirillaceae bacterium]
MPKPVPNTQTGSLTDHQHGTNDTLILADAGTGGTPLQVVLYGDAFAQYDDSRGGNDLLIGGANANNSLVGDARLIYDNARGGNDTLIGAASPADVVHVNVLYGDAFTLQDNARGGSDHLTGGDNSLNVLIGDAGGIAGNGRGGNDHLIGGDGSSDNTLIGDAYFMSDNARGGNDTLVSGTGTDHMWGDAQSINGVAASPTAPTGAVVTGADTFVFAPANGNDDINDFRQSDHDRIDVRAYGFHDIADMTITADGGGNTRIAFDANDGVTLVGIADPHILHPSDFLLA